jgi:hypothetical protein
MTVATYPVAPTTTPLKGTILDVATVVDQFEWLDGVGLFNSFNCMKFDTPADFCGPNAKDFDGDFGWQDGVRFAVYGGVSCKVIGMRPSEMQSAVEKAFGTGEHKGIEQALMEHRFRANAAGSGLPGSWAAPADLNSGGALPVKRAVATLEGHAAANYNGTPTLHLPRSVASLLAEQGAVEWDGNALRTKMGSKIAAGGGYDALNTSPAGAAPAANIMWLYATGEVLIGKSELLLPAPQIDTTTNDVFVLAERGYIAAVDCYTAAVRADLSA